MNQIYIANGTKYNVGPNRKEEFLQKFPEAQLENETAKTKVETFEEPIEPGKEQPTTQKSAEPVGVNGQPKIKTSVGALNLDSNLVNTLLE